MSWDHVDLSNLSLSSLKGKISSEDYERMVENRPMTMLAAKRAGIKEAALMIIYSIAK